MVGISNKPGPRKIQENRETREPEHEGGGRCTAFEGAHVLIGRTGAY